MRKFLTISLFLLILVVGTAGYFVFFQKKDRFDPQRVKITLKPPEELIWGQEASLKLKIENNNKIALNDVAFQLEIPSEFQIKTDQNKIKIGNLGPQDSYEKEVKFTPYGEKNKTKEIKTELSYSPQNTNSVLTKSETSKISITKVPFSIEVGKKNLITPNSQIEYPLSLKNESGQTLSNVEISLTSLQGLDQPEFAPPPNSQPASWSFAKLDPDQKEKIRLRGTVSNAQSLEFEIKITAKNKEGTGALIKSRKFAQNIAENPLALSQKINKKRGPYAAQPGEKTKTTIKVENTTGATIKDIQVAASLDSDLEIIDQKSLQSDQASIDQEKYEIHWNSSSSPALTALGPDTKVELEFEFSVKKEIPITKRNKNLEVQIVTETKSTNPPKSLDQEEVSSRAQSKLKLQTQIDPLAETSHLSGPDPPREGKKSTYGISWKILNTYNDLEDLTVSAYLPENIEWERIVNSEYGDLQFDQEERMIRWKIDNLPHGIGYILPVAQAEFEVSLEPEQEKSPYQLTGEITAEGTDKFTGNKIKTYERATQIRTN